MDNKLLFDREKLLERVGNDTEFVEQLMSLYIKQLGQILLSLQEAVDLEDKTLALALAHKIKGSSVTICCTLIAQKALQLEDHLNNNNFNVAVISAIISQIQLDAKQFSLLSNVLHG
jgi:HPt (histidine-containing phosphotransfer) domain-containing protein